VAIEGEVAAGTERRRRVPDDGAAERDLAMLRCVPDVDGEEWWTGAGGGALST
jgi:hypothetical protein